MSHNDVIKIPLSALETVKIIKVRYCGECVFLSLIGDDARICDLSGDIVEDYKSIDDNCPLEDY